MAQKHGMPYSFRLVAANSNKRVPNINHGHFPPPPHECHRMREAALVGVI